MLARALADHRANRLTAAVAQYRTVLARQPGHPQASHLLGFALLQSGAVAQAEKPLRDSLRRAPGAAAAWTHLGLTLRELGRHPESSDALRRALVLTPGLPDALQAAARWATAAPPRGAERIAKRVVTLSPLQASAWHLLGLSLAGPEQPIGTIDRAVRFFSRAAILTPADAPAMVDLANALRVRRDPRSARDSARRALCLRPASAAGRVALSAALYDIDAIEPAVAAARTAAIIAPATADAYGNLAQCRYRTGRFDLAVRHGRQARHVRPADPQILANLSSYHLALGQLDRGWELFQHRPARRTIARSRWLPPAIWVGGAADRLLVLAEQGLGDELLFASCWGDLAALVRAGLLGAVLVEIDGRLRPLAERSFPELGWLERDRGAAAADGAQRASDFAATHWTAAGDLPSVFRRRIEDFPAVPHYLAADPARVATFRRWLESEAPGRRRVGLCWRSGLRSQDRVKHYPGILDCAPLFSEAGPCNVILQYDDCTAELADITSGAPGGADGRVLVHPDLDRHDDLDGVAALIVALDGVLSAETAVLALAGALGAPAIGFGLGPNWAGLGQARFPWHPTVTRMHRSGDEDWAGLMRRVAEVERATATRGGQTA